MKEGEEKVLSLIRKYIFGSMSIEVADYLNKIFEKLIFLRRKRRRNK